MVFDSFKLAHDKFLRLLVTKKIMNLVRREKLVLRKVGISKFTDPGERFRAIMPSCYLIELIKFHACCFQCIKRCLSQKHKNSMHCTVWHSIFLYCISLDCSLNKMNSVSIADN